MSILPSPPPSTTNNNNIQQQQHHQEALLTSLSKANSTVTTTLHRTIQHHTNTRNTAKKGYNAKTDGLDYLQVKNGLMISYLIDLTLLLRCRLNNKKNGGSDATSSQECLERLLEMKTALEKTRPLEKRMRYQIDKLLALATLGAGTFAAVGREEEEEEKEEEDGGKMERGDEQQMDGGHDEGLLKSSDPLSFKPDLQGMMKMFEEDDNEPNDNDSNSETDASNEDDDDEESSSSYKPKISLEKDDTTNNNNNNDNIYQPPRLQSVPFELDNEQKIAKQLRLLQKQRDKLSNSELTSVIRSQFTDAPEVEDTHGGANLGKQSAHSRKIAMQDADIKEFEETQMIRLTMGRKEKKVRKKMMREELSNLGAIAGGFGSVVAGVDDAFGDGNNDDGSGARGRRGRDYGGDGGGGEDGGDGSFKMKGMRKRKVDLLEGGDGAGRRSSKKKGTMNTYQKSLYGGGDSGGGGGGRGGGGRGGGRGRGRGGGRGRGRGGGRGR